MDEYIKREDAIKHLRGACIAKYPLSFSYGILASANEISKLPAVDVVPKSEVERLQEEANRYKRYFFRHDYDEMIAEVLDKLDRFINANCIEIKDERGIKGYVTSGVHFAIAELKKKYTEVKKE